MFTNCILHSTYIRGAKPPSAFIGGHFATPRRRGGVIILAHPHVMQEYVSIADDYGWDAMEGATLRNFVTCVDDADGDWWELEAAALSLDQIHCGAVASRTRTLCFVRSRKASRPTAVKTQL